MYWCNMNVLIPKIQLFQSRVFNFSVDPFDLRFRSYSTSLFLVLGINVRQLFWCLKFSFIHPNIKVLKFKHFLRFTSCFKSLLMVFIYQHKTTVLIPEIQDFSSKVLTLKFSRFTYVIVHVLYVFFLRL